MQEGNPGDKQMEWTKQFGGAVVYRGFLGNERLLLSDPKALMYVLQTRCYAFPKPRGARSALSNLLGEGVLTTEGDVHKKQRKIINPTFSQAAVRDFLPLFFRHASALTQHLADVISRERQAQCNVHKEHEAHLSSPRSALAAELSPSLMHATHGQAAASADDRDKPSPSVVDMLHWTSRTTLDVIGESAFSYELNSLARGESGDVIADSFNKMMTHVGQLTLIERAQLHFEQFSIFDGLRPLPTSFNKRARACYDAVESVARRMLKERKHGVNEAATEKDVLERVLKANDDPTLKQSQKLLPHEIIGQLTTLILAGHETTSTALTWALYQLALHGDVQEQLRDEIREASLTAVGDEGHLSFEQLMELPLLRKVTDEVMRLNPPVFSTNREAAGDDIIPLQYPVIGKGGREIHSIPVAKGQAVIIHMATYNRRKDIWGDDADVFRPSRWDDLPEAVLKSGIPGYSLSFLAGPRNCIGQKFALTEFKAILSTLLLSFRFSPPPSDLEIRSKQIIVTRPRVRGLEHAGTQMPLGVEPLTVAC